MYLQIERFDEITLDFDTTIKDTVFKYETANAIGSNYNLALNLSFSDIWAPTSMCGFLPSICENKAKIYKVRYSFENLCSKTQVDSFWFTPGASCKTEFNNDSMWLALYSDYFTEHNLNNETISNIEIYPNPTKNYITIENVLNYDIKLMDITGKVLKELNSTSNNFILETNEYSKGTYLFILKDKESGTIKTEKILVH